MTDSTNAHIGSDASINMTSSEDNQEEEWLAEDDEEKWQKEEELLETIELTDDEKLAVLTETVVRHPKNREIYYKILQDCFEERELHDLEERIATYPEFNYTYQNQYHFIQTLVQDYGLDEIEHDEEGNVVLPEMKEGLTEDEIDDLVFSFSYVTTDVGRRFVAIHAPHARIVELFEQVPERKDTYVELMQFIGEKKRAYGEIDRLLRGRPILEAVIDGNETTMQPSVFVDKLQRAGALVWEDGWMLTEEGRSFLEEI